jgi:hypothetical protein
MAVVKHFVCYGCDNYEDVVMTDEDSEIYEPAVTCGGCGEQMLLESERYALDDDDDSIHSSDDDFDEDDSPHWEAAASLPDEDDDSGGPGDGDFLEGIALLFNQNGVRRSSSRGELALNLLDEDVVFFNEGEIAWDGEVHSITGMQFNSAVLSEYPEVEQDPRPFAEIVAEAMMAAEANPNLRVPLNGIHEMLHELLQHEDMTGMTFMNLAASHMFKVRQVDNKCAVMVDGNLIAGIPDAYNLIIELLKSLRRKDSIEDDFDVMFVSARSFDSFGGAMIDEPVPGADYAESMKMVHVTA